MRRSLVETVARLAGWRAVGLATAAVLIAAASFGQAPTLEKKPAAGEKPSAAQQNLPKADEILAKLTEAVGGEAAIKKVTTRVSKGALEQQGMPGQAPMKGTISIYEAAPNKTLQVSDFGNGQMMQQGTDGEVFWLQSPMGTQVAGKDEAAIQARHSDFYLVLNWRKYYTAETAGTEKIGDQQEYKITMTPKEGGPETWYVNEKTNLLDRIDLSLPAGQGTVETYFEDYRKTDGLMLPFKTRQMYAGQQMVAVAFNSVEQNVDIPKDKFEPPADVKDQMKPGGAPSTQPVQPPKPEKPEKPDKPTKP